MSTPTSSLSIDTLLDRSFYAPEKVNTLTRKGVKRPLDAIIDSLPEEQKKKMGRFVEVKLQEITMEMDEKEIVEVDQKVDEKVNGPAKTIPFPLGPTPPEYVTALDPQLDTFVIFPSGLIEVRETIRDYEDRKSTPFPSVLKVKNNVTNQKKAQRIKKLIESGHTAKAFLSCPYSVECLLLTFGRKVQEDLDYVPEFVKQQEEKQRRQAALRQARAFSERVRDPAQPITEAEFVARLTPQKLEEWTRKKNEAMRNLMREVMGYSIYAFNAETWM